MRIALCLEYPIEQFGGTEVLVRELIQGLAESHEIVLVSPDEESGFKNSVLAGKIHRHCTWRPGELSALNSRNLAAKLAAEAVELAHFHFGGNYAWGNRYFGRSPILFVHRAGISCISTNHGAFSILDGYCGPQRRFLRWALFPPAWFNKLRVLACLQTEIAVSQHDYRALRRWYWPLRHKFGWIYHSRIHPPTIPAPAGHRTKTIICVGTIGLRKGQTYLVDAFSRIAADFPDWNLVLIGRHGEKSMLETINATISQTRLAARIRLITQCSNEELAGWLKTAGVFAMPSLFEGLGLSLQEALFAGCPCIASSAGGITDLIEDGFNGLLVEPGNVPQLAHGLKRLLADENLRASLGSKGPESILQKEMTAEKMVAKYDRLYRQVLARRPINQNAPENPATRF